MREQRGDRPISSGGVDTVEEYSYLPFHEAQFGLQGQDLSGIQDHAWYWFQGTADSSLKAGMKVSADVNGKQCGEAIIEERFISDRIVGFHRLVVPADSVTPGCGHLGARVNFLVNGRESGLGADWARGVSRIDLKMADLPAPTATPSDTPQVTPATHGSPTVLPPGGGSAGGDGRNPTALLGFLSVSAGAVACWLLAIRCETASGRGRRSE